MPHVLDQELFPSIAKYPIWRWERDRHLHISQMGWIKLCKKIAANDPTNLELIFDKASVMERAGGYAEPADSSMHESGLAMGCPKRVAATS